jgi:multidrug efflux pump subunit AcrB
MFCMRFVQNQFFPSSDRPEILVDLNLPQNASIEETRKVVDRLEADQGRPGHRALEHLHRPGRDPFLPAPRPAVAEPLLRAAGDRQQRLRRAPGHDGSPAEAAARRFVGVGTNVQSLEMGPPVGRPIQYRVSGKDIDQVRKHAIELATLLDQNEHIGEMIYDWNEPGKVLRIDIAQDKARQLGLSSEDVANVMNSIVSGVQVTQVNDNIYLVNVVARAEDSERGSPETLQNLQIVTPSGTSIPLLAFATVRYELEQPLVWRRDRKPTITIKASVNGEIQPTDLVAQLKPKIDAFASKLPVGYEVPPAVRWRRAARPRADRKVIPLMLFLMATFLMIQLHSVQKLFLVVSVAPLGLIGVVLALVPTGTPMGFVAILGILALAGIIIRNSVILVTQIDEFEEQGLSPWDAVVEATNHRRRPILLTAAAASLGMIPIAREVFWGPMAYAMIGGIISATLLTLLFLPALYVAWYKIREPENNPKPSTVGAGCPRWWIHRRIAGKPAPTGRVRLEWLYKHS